MDKAEMFRKSAANWDNFSEEIRNEQVYFMALAYLQEKKISIPKELSALISFMLLKRQKRKAGE